MVSFIRHSTQSPPPSTGLSPPKTANNSRLA
jgi:hypothetical protein